MNGRSQMQGGKNWILPKDINANRFFLRLSLAGNMEKPLFSNYGTEWRERGYGLGRSAARLIFSSARNRGVDMNSKVLL